ncbi:MAG: FtsW/RodA/SpoVE family cell cycle protein [Candidatus Puniceispirillaceae bacterium]
MFNRTDRSRLGIWWWTVDRMMLTCTLLLMVLGGVLVMAASPPVAERIGLGEHHFVFRQLMFMLPALFVMLVTSILSGRTIRILCLLGGLVITGLMLATLVIGPEVKGATRWLMIGGLRLQPSEFIKPILAIISAWLLGLWREQDNFPGWAWASMVVGAVVAILILQPDVGMTAVVVLTFGFQMFLAGLPLLLILLALALAPLAGFLAYSFLDHVQVRVDKFFAGGNLQTERSIQSFVEGGWYGVGPGDGQVKLHLPDAHADFIFSVAAEEYGLLACLFLIGLFGFVVIRGYAQSLIARDMFSMLAVSGLATQFGVQAAIHMASSLNLIPTKGMTLPFISYGGSSLMASGLTLGLILALSRKQHPSEVSHFDHPAMIPEASR